VRLEDRQSKDANANAAPLDSIFFGGGTPTLWDPFQLGRVIEAIKTSSQGGVTPSGSYEPEGVTPPCEPEVTVECNPNSLDARKAETLQEQGVNRFSIGVQSLHAERLQFLGRLHDPDQARVAVRAALHTGARVSADLIFGLPGQSVPAVCGDLAWLCDQGVQHISAYALTIEPTTEFGRLDRKRRLPKAPEEAVALQYEAVEEQLTARGFEHYEVSNYAMPGQRCRHNDHVWRGGSYLGLGAAAVGCDRNRRAPFRYRNVAHPDRYLTQISIGLAEGHREELTPIDQLRELVMLGLRTFNGVHYETVRTITGLDLREERKSVIQTHVQRGNLQEDQGFLRIPRARWLHLDGIVADLF